MQTLHFLLEGSYPEHPKTTHKGFWSWFPSDTEGQLYLKEDNYSYQTGKKCLGSRDATRGEEASLVLFSCDPYKLDPLVQ